MDPRRQAFLIAIHKEIEESATRAAEQLAKKRKIDVDYPPNGGLTPEEEEAVKRLTVDPTLEFALRKMVAEAASKTVFRLFTLVDGVSDPDGFPELWLGCELRPRLPEEPDREAGEPFWHDNYFDAYWAWRRIRPNPGWKLDNYEGP